MERCMGWSFWPPLPWIPWWAWLLYSPPPMKTCYLAKDASDLAKHMFLKLPKWTQKLLHWSLQNRIHLSWIFSKTIEWKVPQVGSLTKLMDISQVSAIGHLPRERDFVSIDVCLSFWQIFAKIKGEQELARLIWYNTYIGRSTYLCDDSTSTPRTNIQPT